MNEVIKKMGHVYSGNDPISDEKKISQFRKTLKQNVKLDEILKTEDAVSDPYDIFGFGVISYFSMMRIVILGMTILTICFLPTLYIYGQGKAMLGYTGSNIYNLYSLGNIGQSHA